MHDTKKPDTARVLWADRWATQVKWQWPGFTFGEFVTTHIWIALKSMKAPIDGPERITFIC
jgi:hypothetical protein